ncbi:MAG: alanine dehydrogenase [Flavobacteriales bacterium]|nr:alanine dehydrogenase [Flavobacteriales bacterium]
MIVSGDALKSLAQEAALMPQEEMLEVGKKNKKLYIGIPKETSFMENRVALAPEAVGLLTAHGHTVVIETKAGTGANFTDSDYSEAGARIAYDTEEVFKADLIFKVAPPTNTEIEMMQMKQTLFSALQLAVQPKNTLKKLMEKKVTAIAWDYVKDNSGIFPVIRSMGEIAGNTAILTAGRYLSEDTGRGMMLGGVAGIAPAEVVIIGAGTVAEFAARAALGLGAIVKVFDNSTYKLRRLQNSLGQRIYTSVITPKVLAKALRRADVAIGSLRAQAGRTPMVVTETMVQNMKEGSVIIDVSIDQGGCFETSRVTSHEDPIYKEFGIVHYCVPNIASSVPRTASFALSNIFAPLIIDIGEGGGMEKIIYDNPGFRHGVYMYRGALTSSYLGETFGLPYQDLNLLMAAR